MNSGQKTKVLLAITKANWGGAQKYVYDLANGLVDGGFNVEVVLGGHGPLKEKLELTEIPTISLPSLGRDIKFFADLRSAWHLFKIFRVSKPDILHLNSSKMLVLGAITGYLSGINKIVYTGHGWAFNEERSTFSKFLLKQIYKFSLLFVDKIIFVSKQTKSQAENNGFRLHPEKTVVIYNGISDSGLFSPDEARETIMANMEEKELRIFPKNEPIVWIGTVAELHKSKGLTYAINAMTSLPQNIHYFIIGGGEERHSLKSLIVGLNLTSRVHLTGPINGAGKLITAFDVFVLPSITEALPYVILEAGLAKVAVIASEVGGISEIIHDENSGILIEPRRPTEISNAVNFVLENPEKARDYATNLHNHITAEFSLQKMIDSTVNLYDKML